MAEETIDPKNLPAGSQDVSIGILYKGKVYDRNTGKLLDIGFNSPEVQEKMDATGGSVIPGFGNNGAGLFGLDPEVIRRGGQILLGSAIAIIGVAMLISGTKTADLAKSLIPVAGKVL